SIQEAIEKKENVLIFPEGTFAYAKGLHPFKIGAFQLAVNTQTPLCPLALSGAREFMRSGNYLLSWTPIKVTVGDPIIPQKQDWQEAVKL
ncbi:lysophospholipid acyltransferase family protein, partial [Acinetobacter baumannii]